MLLFLDKYNLDRQINNYDYYIKAYKNNILNVNPINPLISTKLNPIKAHLVNISDIVAFLAKLSINDENMIPTHIFI
jgi:hypothetical protein